MSIKILDLPVLSLNANWQIIDDKKTVKRAFEDLNSGSFRLNENGNKVWSPAFKAMDVELNKDGTLYYANPVDMDEWMTLPVRPGDEYIYTAKQAIRVPRIIITSNFSKINVRAVKLSNDAIHKRDRHQCQYCYKFFPLEELNVDHVIPRHHGGKDEFENMVCSCKKCNTRKGHNFNHEIGYKLLKEPKEPLPMPVSYDVKTAKHPSWVPFIPVK